MLVLGNGHMGPPMNRQKHTIENIIFLQLRWPAAKIQVPNYFNEPVTDPGFPRRGGWGATFQRGRQHTILPNFRKNCMKLKKFGPPGGAPPCTPLRSATVKTHTDNNIIVWGPTRKHTYMTFNIYGFCHVELSCNIIAGRQLQICSWGHAQFKKNWLQSMSK